MSHLMEIHFSTSCDTLHLTDILGKVPSCAGQRLVVHASSFGGVEQLQINCPEILVSWQVALNHRLEGATLSGEGQKMD